MGTELVSTDILTELGITNDRLPWLPLIVEGRTASRTPAPVEILVLMPNASNLDLLKDPNVQWFCKNFRSVIGDRRFAVEALRLGSHRDIGRTLYAELLMKKKEIMSLFKQYKPKLVVVFGAELAKILKPALLTRSDKNVAGYVHRLEFGPKPPMICIPHLLDDQHVARNLDEFICTFIKVPFMLENPNADKEGEIIDLSTDESAKKYLEFLANEYDGYIAYDTETRNLNKRYNNRLACMQFATDTNKGYVLYWNHDYNKRSREHDEKVLKPLLKKIFSGRSKIKGLYAHNAQFDISSTRFGLEIDYWGIPTFDTILILSHLDQNRRRNDRLIQPLAGNSAGELKQLVNEFFGYDGYEAEAKAARKDGSLIDLPYDRLTKYAGQDGFVEFRLVKFLLYWAKILGRRDDIMRFSKYIHSRALRTFQDMSYEGMLIDIEHVNALEHPQSAVSKELDRVRTLFKNDPVTIGVNKALLKKRTNASNFWMIPWIFDIAKPMSKMMLFFDKKVGLGLEPLKDPKDKKAEPKASCDEHFQTTYKAIPQVKWLTEFSEIEKLRNTYISKMSIAIRTAKKNKTDLVDGCVHPIYNLNGTDTGRLSCIKKGTYVEVLRDLTINPLGIKIEDVKPGDLVYCYTDDGRPAIRKVKWAGKTGRSRCIRLYWKSEKSSGDLGYVDVTADHKIKTTERGWIRADQLIPGEGMYAMLRHGELIMFTSENKYSREYRRIYEISRKKKADNKEHIHHKDFNHYNNVPSNLASVTASEHRFIHAAYTGNSVSVDSFSNDIYNAQHLSRSEMNCSITRYQLIRLLFRYNAKPSNIDGWWYSDIIEACEYHNLDWRSIQFRFNDTRYLSRTYIKSVMDAWHSNTGDSPTSTLGVGSRRLKAICAFYGIQYGSKSKKVSELTSYETQYAGLGVVSSALKKTADRKRVFKKISGNHVVIRTIEIPGIHDVYCLEVEGLHNFVAGGICVKNCQKPNLQQIPRADNEFKKAVKSVFITEVGTCILQADFAAAEVRMWGSLSKDRFLCELLTNSFNKRAAYRANPTDIKLRDEAEIMADVHKQTASLMFGVSIESVDKALRTITKGITFGLIYGRGTRSIAEQLGKSEEETQALCNKFFAQFPDGVAWLDEMKQFVQRHRYIETPFKRRRYLPWVKDKDQGLVALALRQAINSPVQSASGDFATLSISLLHEELHRTKMDKRVKLINAVHDSTLVKCPQDVDTIAEISAMIRDCFTVKSKAIAEDVFGFEMPAPMDIDMEISQRKAWKCTKCGNVYKAYKSKCDKTILGEDKKPLKDEHDKDLKCSHTSRTEVKLNGGWGTLIGLDETMSGYREAAMGF